MRGADARAERARAAEHYADDLEVELEEIMLADFAAEVEDDSPRLVSCELVALYGELLGGEGSTLERLRRSTPAGTSTSLRQTVRRLR